MEEDKKALIEEFCNMVEKDNQLPWKAQYSFVTYYELTRYVNLLAKILKSE